MVQRFSEIAVIFDSAEKRLTANSIKPRVQSNML